MTRKIVLFCVLILMLTGGFVSFAQYTGSELEQKQPENLYPQPGPGDLLIVDQLKETNRILQEQSKILAEQNRILSESLQEIKKRQSNTDVRHR